MTNEEIRVWGIHTRNDNLFLKENIIAIGWKEMGNLILLGKSREDFKEKYIQTYPNEKKGSFSTCAGMLYRFCYEMQIGDYVIFPSKINREINIGIIEGEYFYDSSQSNYVQTRKVKWLKHLPRTFFSQGALYEIGSALTLFSVKNYADEFIFALSNSSKHNISLDSDDESVGATAGEIIESTKDFILKELSRQLK
ncbi:MAG: restriction endonuclease, partial [Clostridia bacterium]|nr:restriction endonuclease [Clostridia bacterium]